MKTPTLLTFDKIGSLEEGFISVLENDSNLPFEVKRVYWTYFTPNHIERGRHAHKELQQLIIAVSGIIEFALEDQQGQTEYVRLDRPDQGLYIPPGYWREIRFSHNAVLLCLASDVFRESDYIRDYETFKGNG